MIREALERAHRGGRRHARRGVREPGAHHLATRPVTASSRAQALVFDLTLVTDERQLFRLPAFASEESAAAPAPRLVVLAPRSP